MTKTSLVLVGLLVTGSPGWSQPPEAVIDPVNGLSIEDVVARALRVNGDILVSQETVAAAQGNHVYVIAGRRSQK